MYFLISHLCILAISEGLVNKKNATIILNCITSLCISLKTKGKQIEESWVFYLNDRKRQFHPTLIQYICTYILYVRSRFSQIKNL